MYDSIAVGELLIDFAEIQKDSDGYPTMQANPGGAPANFLGALTKYGKKTAFIGKVGDDTFGHLLIASLNKANIETKGVLIDPDYFTTLAFVTFDDKGERTFSFSRKHGADTRLTFEEVDLSIIDNTKAVHFGTVNLPIEPARSATRKAIEYAKTKGKMITFDPNLRKPLWDNLEDAKEQIKWGLKQADFVKISDEEVEFLWNCTPLEGAQKILDEYNVSLVLLTLGIEGSIAMTKNAKGIAKCPKVKPVDTTGAGDICGGSAFSIYLDYNLAFDELTEKELTAIAQFGSTAASLSTEKFGGIPSIPEKEDVLKLI